MRMHNKFSLTIVTALLTLSLWGLEALAAPPAEHPNSIFIFADDLGYGGLGCYGQEKIKHCQVLDSDSQPTGRNTLPAIILGFRVRD